MPHDPARGEDAAGARGQGTPRGNVRSCPGRSRRWLAAAAARHRPVITDPAERRLVGTEMLVVLTVTLGLSALRSALSLLNALLQPVPLNEQQVALNAPARRGRASSTWRSS